MDFPTFVAWLFVAFALASTAGTIWAMHADARRLARAERDSMRVVGTKGGV